MSGAPNNHHAHDLDLPLDSIRDIAPTIAPGFDQEQIVPSKDGKLNPNTEDTDPAALEPHMDLNSWDICVTGTPDSSPVISSEPYEPADAELDRLSIFEFGAADIFQHSPLGNVLNSLKKPVLGWGLIAELCSVRVRG